MDTGCEGKVLYEGPEGNLKKAATLHDITDIPVSWSNLSYTYTYFDRNIDSYY